MDTDISIHCTFTSKQQVWGWARRGRKKHSNIRYVKIKAFTASTTLTSWSYHSSHLFIFPCLYSIPWIVDYTAFYLSCVHECLYIFLSLCVSFQKEWNISCQIMTRIALCDSGLHVNFALHSTPTYLYYNHCNFFRHMYVHVRSYLKCIIILASYVHLF